jgi:hypothetical protein
LEQGTGSRFENRVLGKYVRTRYRENESSVVGEYLRTENWENI